MEKINKLEKKIPRIGRSLKRCQPYSNNPEDNRLNQQNWIIAGASARPIEHRALKYGIFYHSGSTSKIINSFHCAFENVNRITHASYSFMMMMPFLPKQT